MTTNISTEHQLRVSLDGQPLTIPPEMRSFKALCSHLNSLAGERQRVVSSLSVEVESKYLQAAAPNRMPRCRITAKTTNADRLHVNIIRTALQQVETARALVQEAVVHVQVNDGCVATEYWGGLSEHLEEPLVTLSALPENICSSSATQTATTQLRQWQFEQLAAMRDDVDEACRRKDGRAILNALEHRVLSWLNNLHATLALWLEMLLLGSQTATAE
jgi:hypothetical protein